MPKSKVSLIYLAGFVDGEGCFSILRSAPGGRKKKYAYPALTISQVNKEVLDWIKSNFGGTIHLARKAKGNISECWQWRLSWGKARILAKELQPYLIVKREQVKKVL
jgi:hypothetical protein